MDKTIKSATIAPKITPFSSSCGEETNKWCSYASRGGNTAVLSEIDDEIGGMGR